MNRQVCFFNLDLGSKLTGVERSSCKRAQLFSKYLKIHPHFITAKLNLNLRKNWQHYQKMGWIPAESTLSNVYEDVMCIAQGEAFAAAKFQVGDYDVQIISASHERYYKTGSSFNCYVVWTDEHREKIDYINYFILGKKTRRDKFNLYGQLAVTQYLDQNGRIQYEDLFTPQGLRCLTQYYNEKSQISAIYLYRENGILGEVFTQLNMFLQYWCQHYMPDHQQCIIDKNRYWVQPLSELREQKNLRLISIVHSNHMAKMGQDLMLGVLNSNYKPILEQQYQVDQIVTLTQQQKNDILKRFPMLKNIQVIPHSIDQVPQKIFFAQRNPNKIVALSRLAPEKQVMEIILMMRELIKLCPQAELYIYGDGPEKNALYMQIQLLKLNQHIHLIGYVENIADAYRDAVFSVLTSRCEGFSLAVLESLSYGVPAAAYDVPYGPSSMIQQGSNGILVEHADYQRMADEMAKILNVQDHLQAMSEAAYDSIERYHEENVALAWQQLMS